MSQLLVWGKLRTGYSLHWLLVGCKPLGHRDINNNVELYLVPALQLRLIDIVEFLCGYRRVPYQQTNRFIYVKGNSNECK